MSDESMADLEPFSEFAARLEASLRGIRAPSGENNGHRFSAGKSVKSKIKWRAKQAAARAKVRAASGRAR